MFEYDKDDTTIIIRCDSSAFNSSSIATDIFKEGQIWKDRDLLYSTVKVFAGLTGWKPCIKSKFYIRCSCYKKPDDNERNYASSTIRRSCQWSIKIKSTRNKHVMIKSGTTKGKLKSCPNVDSGTPIIISIAKCVHTGTCNPSTQQQILQRKRGGSYISNIGDYSMFILCGMYQKTGYVTNGVVKDVLQLQFPSNKNVTKYDVYNMKKKIRRITPYMNNITDFNDFQTFFSSSKLEIGVDNVPISDDNIVAISKEVWTDIINEKGYDEKSFLTFVEFMKLLQESNKGFEYRLMKNAECMYTGCVWQTATMRSNFERFGGFISIDAMNREINMMEWPYISVTMYNELEKVCLGCEAIMTAERHEAYSAIIDFMLEYSPLRKREEIYVVAADGAVTQESITNIYRLPNAKYMADQWHLFDSILPLRFGKYYFELLHPTLKGMCHAISQDQFNECYDKGMTMLQERESRNINIEDELEKFNKEKATYASYLLKQMRGTRGYHGSSLSESNHSSVLVYLNKGMKRESNYKKEPLQLVKDLFKRQEIHVNKWNEEIYHDAMKLHLIEEKFDSATPQALEVACASLCLKSYRKYEAQYNRISEYEKINISDCEIHVKSLMYPTAPVRRCLLDEISQTYICGKCEISCVYEIQCIHS